MRRLFIGFKIDDSDGHHLISLIKNSNQPLADSIRWTYDGNFHITSHFIPQCDEKYIPDLENAMINALQKAHDNRILIEKIGLFPQYGSTLCAAIITPTDLIMTVHKRLQMHLEKLSIPIELRQYIPHITLARGLPKQGHFETIEMQHTIHLNTLILYESSLKEGGAHYIPLITLPIF